MASTAPSSDSSPALVDQAFIGVRAKLIEVAAFLDRIERHGLDHEFRCAALKEAAALLNDGKPDRAKRILEKLSDPTTVPAEAAEGKAACGVYHAPGK